MEQWDSTQTFPDEMKTGCPDTDRVRERIWKMGEERYAESMRDARLEYIQHRAAGHVEKLPPDHWVFSKFPEVEAKERMVEEDILERQKIGDMQYPPM